MCPAIGLTPAVDNVEEQVTKSATSSSKTTSSAISENHSYQHQESYIEQVSSVSKSKQYIQQTASEEFLVRERLVNGKHDSVSTLNSVQQLSTSTTTSSGATNGNGTTEHDNHLNGTAQSANRFHVFKLDRLNIPQTGGPVTEVYCDGEEDSTREGTAVQRKHDRGFITSWGHRRFGTVEIVPTPAEI
uniref:Uncharacterized protein n=1 Tax=Anopheles maculatus TaxID=74869 RepID=A0A182SYB2_9DIPT